MGAPSCPDSSAIRSWDPVAPRRPRPQQSAWPSGPRPDPRIMNPWSVRTSDLRALDESERACVPYPPRAGSSCSSDGEASRPELIPHESPHPLVLARAGAGGGRPPGGGGSGGGDGGQGHSVHPPLTIFPRTRRRPRPANLRAVVRDRPRAGPANPTFSTGRRGRRAPKQPPTTNDPRPPPFAKRGY